MTLQGFNLVDLSFFRVQPRKSYTYGKKLVLLSEKSTAALTLYGMYRVLVALRRGSRILSL